MAATTYYRQAEKICGRFLQYIKELEESGNYALFFDLETTGLSKKTDKILSFSAVKAVCENGSFKKVKEYNLMLNPEMHIPEEATKTNHITDDMVKGKPTEAQALPEILKLLNGAGMICGYNSTGFDQQILDSACRRAGMEGFAPKDHFDILWVSKAVVDSSSYTLQTITELLGLESGITFHESLGDTRATMRLTNLLIPMAKSMLKKKPEREYPKAVSCKRIKRSHKNDRLYIDTEPYMGKIYLDFATGVWHSEKEDVPLKLIRRQVLFAYSAADEKELKKKIS